ncbi:glycoside hydrolase family 53 protein [Pseudonocardia lacus]|uniref:glycoside hydrolase family 53 protein n=1 Tax=Pseudonocardia lacus TaxID=2835865 RepID=UPI001BDCACD0|nr:glycosyl hydrolase 53 family protein [Pseudonocardia lacus]
MLNRRRLLSVAAVAAAATACAAPAPVPVPVPAPGPTPRLRMRGADISFALQLEAAGSTVAADGGVRPVESVLAAHGANLVRLRAWVDPPTGYSDLAMALRLGRRAAAAGCAIHLDLHYSDFWADPRSQRIPAAWQGLDGWALAEVVRAHTRDAVAAFAAQGTPLSMIQIGNEVTWGMLWPVGQIVAGPQEHWDGFAGLLHAGLAGAREAAPDLATMVHIERSGDPGGSRRFFDTLFGRGIDVDVIGLSYYPFWHGSLDDLTGTLHLLAERYGKDVLVVETAYPSGLPADDRADYFVTDADDLPDGDRFPPTPDGQAAFFEELRAVLAAVPGDRGAGFCVWEPAWRGHEVGVRHGEGNPYANLAMFDDGGRPLPALAAFRP